MINVMKFNFIILSFIILLLSCDPVDDQLVVKNESHQKAYFLKSPDRDLYTMNQRVVSEQGTGSTYLNFINEIEADSTKHMLITGSGKAWQRYINEACEDGKLRIYTFSIDTLKKYSWKEVMENNYYLKKMEFSVDDLEKQNWEIKLP